MYISNFASKNCSSGPISMHVAQKFEFRTTLEGSPVGDFLLSTRDELACELVFKPMDTGEIIYLG